MNWNVLVTMIPTFVGLGEKLFSHKPKSGPDKKQLVLQLAQTAIISALGVDPNAFGPAEQELVGTVNDAVVKYYNAKGWPTQ